MSSRLREIRALITDHAGRSAAPAVAGLSLFLERAPSSPVTLLFRPTLYLVFQGAKELLLDDRRVS